jgi:exosortase D (VPLPA-CTERM-specific)
MNDRLTLTARLPALQAPRAALWIGSALAALIVLFTFRDGVLLLLDVWGSKEEYSFGYLIPFISLFMFWQKKDELARVAFSGSWVGFGLVTLGVALLILGRISALATFFYYGLVVAIVGLVLARLGWKAAAIVWGSLFVLVFMVPLPAYAFIELSQALQLLSSKLGVAVIRLFGISVYLEGNVIDLGSLKLQVVEACSGLRYLFPLMTLGFIAVYFYRGAAWKKIAILASTVPITIGMNSLRIGIIGVTVEFWGKAMAEGFLHNFEGWLVFMLCTLVLLGEMWALARLGGERQAFGQILSINWPGPSSRSPAAGNRPLSVPYLAALGVVLVAGVYTLFAHEREPITPHRNNFIQFPMQVGQWSAKAETLESIYLTELKLDDYVLATYASASRKPVNFYVSYYAAQIKGNAAHSPRACMPGDGWEILSMTRVRVPQGTVNGLPLYANRALIRKGGQKALVYYWFQARGRVVTNEYLVKLYNLWDAIVRNRSDGAMVRLVTVIDPGESEEAADARVAEFAQGAVPLLDDYVPL